MKEKKKITAVIAPKYQKARKKEKGNILDQFITTTQYNRSYAAHVLKTHGKKVWINTNTVIVGDEGVDGAVFNLKDITEIKQVHERIKHAERLASIGTLVRETAHEVRNPLAAIKGIIQMIGEDINEGNQKKSYIEAIMREIDRLNRVVDNLLEKGKSETVGIREILHRAVLLCSQNEAWKDIRAIEEYDETLELSNIDERLNQAFYNVILNAFESVEKDGEVIVRAKSISSFIIRFSENPPNSSNSFLRIDEQTLLKKKVFIPRLGNALLFFISGASGELKNLENFSAGWHHIRQTIEIKKGKELLQPTCLRHLLLVIDEGEGGG